MATQQTTLAQGLTALASLLFQNKTPNGELAKRTFFLQAGAERLYRSFDWTASQKTETDTTDSDGILDIEELNFGAGIPAFSYIGPGDTQGGYILTPGDELYNYSNGDRRYAVVLNEDNEWEVHTTEPDTDLTFTWWDTPALSSGSPVIFTPMLLAKAALIYYRQAQDQDADTSVEEDQLAQEVKETLEAQERRRPQRFAQSPRDRYGGGIGAS